MYRNERRTCWISGWIGLDLFLSRLSSMELAWFLITSDLTVCHSRLSSRTATISWSVHDKSSRYETTEDSSNRWNYRVTVMTFFCLFLRAQRIDVIRWEVTLETKILLLSEFYQIRLSTSSSLWHRKGNVDPKSFTRRILREQISRDGELEKWDDPAPWQDWFRFSSHFSNLHLQNRDDTNRSFRHTRISAWARKSLSQSKHYLRRVQLLHYSTDSEEWIFRARTDFE